MANWWFDAHLDLAYLAVRGRDMLAPLGELCGPKVGPDPPASVTLPSLVAGNVRFALATIFTEPVEGDPAGLTAEQYAAGDAEAAHRRGRAQLEAYMTWTEQEAMALDLRSALTVDLGVGEIRGGMGVARVLPAPPEKRLAALARDRRLHAAILMENADPIRTPQELSWWVERGVMVVGLCWAKPSRYASGNSADPADRIGITPLGRELVREMARLKVVPDASHLSDRSLEDLFELTPGLVVASHSNCRPLIDRPGQGPTQRHLTDRAVREIARRGGVIGLNLFSPFLIKGGTRDRRATIEEALAHVERICELTGSKEHVGLGSDMDGGFGGDRLPAGIDQPRDLRRLSDALARRGWSEAEVEGFAWRNWCRCLEQTVG